MCVIWSCIFGVVVHLLGISDTPDDFLYVLDGHGLHASFLLLGQQLGYTALYVVCDFLSAFPFGKVGLHALQVFL